MRPWTNFLLNIEKRPAINDVRAAAERLEGIAVRTPLLESERLNDRAGARVLLKCEMFQPIGAFKVRGAWNMISRISESVIRNGVVAYSSGNHAQAVAWVALRHGTSATIVMPKDAPRVKIANTERLGAEIVLYDRNNEDREAIAAEIAERTGATVVPPYDQPEVIAGQGTVALEAMEQMAKLGVTPDTVVVPCSGGGLIAGCAIAVKDAAPNAQVLAAEPENFDDTARSLEAGERVFNEQGHTSICDALLVPTPGKITFEILRRLVSSGIAVTETEVREAVRSAFFDAHLVVEPGGAVGLAGLLSGRIQAAGENVCIVLSGGNIDRALFTEILRD